MRKENIIKFNSKNQLHGYQERYAIYGLYYRGNHKNHKVLGYTEFHSDFDKATNFYIR